VSSLASCRRRLGDFGASRPRGPFDEVEVKIIGDEQARRSLRLGIICYSECLADSREAKQTSPEEIGGYNRQSKSGQVSKSDTALRLPSGRLVDRP